LKSINRILITGGLGFIGSHIVDELLRMEKEVYVLDDLSTGNINNLYFNKNNPLLHILEGDISKINHIKKKIFNIDVVFHKAAIASVTKSIINPKLVFNSNVRSTLEVLEYCLKTNVKRIVFASSSAVYGNTVEEILTEKSPCKPSSPYGASKLAAESFLMAYWETYGLESVSLRYFNVYGPRQSNNEYSGVITIFINKLLKNEHPVIYGDGNQVRDFVNIQDIVQSNILAMESKNSAGEVFNIGTGQSTKIINLIEVLSRLLGKKGISYEFAPQRKGDINISLASIDKAKRLLNYNPRVNLESGLKSLVNWIKD
jgi:nucleoside-diphosphate-sugar epimerase